MKNIYFPDWDDIDEHDFQTEILNFQNRYILEKYQEDLQRKIDLFCQQSGFLFLQKEVKTMGVGGSFFQGKIYDDVLALGGNDFILELEFFVFKDIKETQVNNWEGNAKYFKKIFFFPETKAKDIQNFLTGVRG